MQSQLHQTPSRRPASFREPAALLPAVWGNQRPPPPTPGHAVFASSTSAKSLARDSPGGIYCGPRFHQPQFSSVSPPPSSLGLPLRHKAQ